MSEGGGSASAKLMYDFCKYVNSYLSDYIRLADAKAGALFAVSGSLLGLVIQQSADPSEFGRAQLTLFLVSCVLLALSILVAILVVFPREPHEPSRNVIYWRQIRRYSEEGYVRAVSELTGDEAAARLSRHSFELAGIAARKYDWLQRGFMIGAVGAVPSITYLATF